MNGLARRLSLRPTTDAVVRWFAYDPSRRRSRLRGPMAILLQTIDRCNAACIMCPYSGLGKTGPANQMDDGLYLHILREARRIGTLQAFLPMLQDEPLLDRQLAARLRLAREVLGAHVRLGIVTNASLLTESRLEEIADCGLDVIEVSLDAHDPQTYSAIRRGLDFERVTENTRALLRRQPRPHVMVRFLRQQRNEAEERDFVRYWRSQGAQVHVMTPSNRAGTLPGYEDIAVSNRQTWKGKVRRVLGRLLPCCVLPFASMSVLWDGRVPLCCQDWGPKEVVGDLSKQSLTEVWHGEAMSHHRYLLWTGRFRESAVCADCSVVTGQGGTAD